MLLEITNLTKNFSSGRGEIHAVDHVNLKVDKGEFYSIIGKSGSGKSTFMNLIAGFLTPTEGSVIWAGEDIHKLSDKEASFLRNQKIGSILQNDSILPNLTVSENVILPSVVYHKMRKPTERAKELLDIVGIGDLYNAYPKELSGGELRRVAIARALMNKPDIILADEPTSNIDVDNTDKIMKIFRAIADRGTAVLMVTHDLDTISYGDVTYRMEDGKMSKLEGK